MPGLWVNNVTLQGVLPRVRETVSSRRKDATSRHISWSWDCTFASDAKSTESFMSTGISNSPDSRYWRQMYRAALFEIEDSKLPARIAEAEKAVASRARELSQAAGDNREETEALDHAIHALHALRSNFQNLG